MIVASKRWDGVLQWLETAFMPYGTTSGIWASDWRRRYASSMCTFFQSCFMEPRHGHLLLCLRRSSMHVSSGVWEGFYASHTSNASLTPKCYGEPTRHSSLQFCVTDVYGSSDMLPGQMRGWSIREHCAQLYQGYRVTGGVLPADPDSHGREPFRKIWVHSSSVCTRHGDKLRIVNNGNGPWNRLCSIMGPGLPLMMMIISELHRCICAVSFSIFCIKIIIGIHLPV